MLNKKTLKVMIIERLSEAAEEIFALFEQALDENQRESDRTTGVPRQTQTEGQEELVKESAEAFPCKMETEHVMIMRQDEPQTPMTKVQQHTNREREAETDDSAESNPEEEHSGEKPFRCPVCERRFSQIRGVKLHMRRAHASEGPPTPERRNEQRSPVHAEAPGDRPFSCPVCKQRFPLLKRVRVHMRSHAGAEPCKERTFSCTVAECSKRFKHERSVYQHVRTAHRSGQSAGGQCEGELSPNI